MINDATPSNGTSEPETITFVAYCEPPWQSGNYTLTAKHSVTSNDAASGIDDAFSDSLSFVVSGPRFSLPSPYVYTTFPPTGASGDYSSVLPHVVLTVETLPWQRNPAAAPEPGAPPQSWLALLLFDENDPPPAVTPGTVQDLLPSSSSGVSGHLPAGVQSYPGLAASLEPADAWQGTDGTPGFAALSYIDVPAALFSEIAPSATDLSWLAHAREMSALPVTPGSGSAEAEYSVVVSNRLPTRGSSSLCCLVSLEGMADWLPPNAPPAGTTAVRLAVLASWGFACLSGGATGLVEDFNQLSKQPALLQIPSGATTGATVSTALAMGYTAFNHSTRQGASTVSWYRGPLLPYQNLPVLEPPFGSADAVLRYDPETGMFDTSYAAAWQLGQLLALNDKDFSTALYNWKVGQQLSAVHDLETQILAEQLNLPSGTLGGGGAPLQVQLVQSTLKPALTRLLNKGMQS